MEIITDEKLESTGYRCLFEGIKQEGIEPFLTFTKDVQQLPSKETLVRLMLIGINELSILEQKHRDIIKYIIEQQKDFAGFNFLNEHVFSVLNGLSEDITSLNLYLENARRLEDLKVRTINFITRFDKYEQWDCVIYRDKTRIVNIKKYYTDGQIKPKSDEIVRHYDSVIPFTIEDNPSFLLEANNCERLYQCRDIYISNFGFNGTKLPTEEELQSYEIPKQYCLK